MVNDHVIAILVDVFVGVLVFKAVKQIVKLLGFLVAAGFLEEILFGLYRTHAVLPRQTLRTSDGVNHINGLIPHFQIAESASVHQEHLDLRRAMQCLALVGQCQFHGLLRVAKTTLAVGDERQVVLESVHAVSGAEFAQGELVVALTVGDECQRFTGEVNSGSLTSHPLGMLESILRIVLLLRKGGENMQTDVLRVLLGQAAQTLPLIRGQHRPFHTLGHLRLVRATIGVRVLRGEAHRAVGIAARTVHVFRALLLTVLALLLLRELAVAVTAVIVTTVIATEVAAIAIPMEVTTIIAAIITMEVTTVSIPMEVTTIAIATEITAIIVAVLVARVLAVLAFVGTVATLAARLETVAVAARTIAAVAALVEASGLAVRLAVAAATFTITIATRRITLAILAATRLETLTIMVATRAEAFAVTTRTIAAVAGTTTLVEVAALAVRLAVAAVAFTITIAARRVTLAILAATRLETLTIMTRLETALAARLETLATAVARSAIAIPLMAAAVGLAGTLVTFCHYLFSLIRC